ncbi:toxin-antitoxin system YwqK family antitoxin [Pontibacter ruber]|uniref:Toxin-antitoxin system YwqK family antitoxin n=1 Tax=Pontibacter ruber TaxID=1343895 RepID=A0ABW5D0E0_9BACT|nr:hypothetical protein [Pontibacter ruber]
MRNINSFIGVLFPLLLLACTSNEQRVVKTYYEDGVLESEVRLISDKLHGESKYYYPNGKLKLLIPCIDGKIDGQSFEYFDSGSLKVTKSFKEDTLHGWTMSYSKNGKVRTKTKYVKGMTSFSVAFFDSGDTVAFYNKGKAIRYFENGKIEQITCSQGQEISTVRNLRFSRDGNIIKHEEPLGCLTRRDSLLLDEQYPNWKGSLMNSLD